MPGEFRKPDSYPGGDIPTGPPPPAEPTLALWREKQWPITYLQTNPKRAEINDTVSQSFLRYNGHKDATTIAAAIANGASASDERCNLEHGYMALNPPPENRALGLLADNQWW